MADRTVSSICSVLCVLSHCTPASRHSICLRTQPLVFSSLSLLFSVLIHLSFSFAQEQFEWFKVSSC